MTNDQNHRGSPAPLDEAEFHVLLALSSGEREESDIMRQVKSDSKGDVILGPGALRGKLSVAMAAGLIMYTSFAGFAAAAPANRPHYRLTEKGKAVLLSEVEAQAHNNPPQGFTA